jgi:VanZ family protein
MNVKNIYTFDFWLTCWTTVLILVVAMSLIPSFSPPGAAFHVDKILHFSMYFFLTAVPLARFIKRNYGIISAGLMPVLGFVIEYGQKHISGREFSPEDMIANNIGAIAGILVGILLRLQRRFKRISSSKQMVDDYEKNSISLQ